MKVSGIYLILIAEKLFYIGQAVDLNGRRLQHLSHLRNGKSKCRKLQKAFSEYGEAHFRFQVLQECAPDKSVLASVEKKWLDVYMGLLGEERILNMCLEEMTSVLGIKRSEETRKRLSVAAKNRKPMTQETRDKISATKRANGDRPSASHMAMLAEKATGRKMPQSLKDKLVSMKVGKAKPQSEIERRTETRRANAAAKGKRY